MLPPLAKLTSSTIRVDPSEILVVPRNHSTVGVGIPTAAQWKEADCPTSTAMSSGGTVIVGGTGKGYFNSGSIIISMQFCNATN